MGPKQVGQLHILESSTSYQQMADLLLTKRGVGDNVAETCTSRFVQQMGRHTERCIDG